jgi:natural product precursor
MKKQIKKLNLNKRTISNLDTPEMTKVVGGRQTANCFTDFRCTQGCGTNNCAPTQHGHTCNGNC